MKDRMLVQLAQCEFAMQKSDFAGKMMNQELKNYETISKTIEAGIEKAKSQIENQKQNLIVAKKIRKNRMEYDVLAKVINQQPDRKDTVAQLDELKRELKELEDRNVHLQRKLGVKQKEFTVLMRSIAELSKMSDDEDGDEDPEKMSMDDEPNFEDSEDVVELA
jgi:THO complex subunit 7